MLSDGPHVVVVAREEPLAMRRAVVNDTQRRDVIHNLTARRHLERVADGRAGEAVDEIERERRGRLRRRPARDPSSGGEPISRRGDSASALRVHNLPEEVRVVRVDERPFLDGFHARGASPAHGE